MKNLITIIFLGMFLLTFVSAISGGECDTIEFPNEDDVSFSVSGNDSNMEGFNWTKNGTIIEYCFDILYYPDKFTLRWWNYQEVYVEDSSTSGGSSSGIYYSNLEDGLTKTLYKNSNVAFKLTKPHNLKVLNIGSDSVEIRIMSNLIYVTLSVGEEKEFSIDKEGYYDLYLKLNSIENNKITLTIKKIDKLIEVEEVVEEIIEEEVEEVEETKNNSLLVIGGIICMILIILFVIVIFKIKSNSNIELEGGIENE